MFERAEFVFASRHGRYDRVSRVMCRMWVAFSGVGSGRLGRAVVSSRDEERAHWCAWSTRSCGGDVAGTSTGLSSSFQRGAVPFVLLLVGTTATSTPSDDAADGVNPTVPDLILERQRVLIQNALPGQDDRLSVLVRIPTGFALANLRVAEDGGGETLTVEFEAFGFAARAAFVCLA